MKSEANRFITGSVALVATRVAERSLGLVSTLIIARLLTPEDFGLVAIAMLAVTFFDILSNTGATQYIVQKSEVTKIDINTAWTLNLLLKILLFLVVIIAAPLIATFYDDLRLENVLIAVSLIAPISAAVNPGIYLHFKDQDYRVIVRIQLIKKLSAVLTTIGLAILYQNYWSLIVGHIVASLVYSTLSYLYINYKPSFDVAKIREQWSFSRWMLMKEILGFLRSQSDMFLVGKFFSIGSMGGYHISKYISSMPTTELVQPALGPLLASFSRSKSDRSALLYQVEIVFTVVSLLVVPISIYMYFFSSQIVAFLLGDQWERFGSIFGVLALVAISSEIVRIPSTIMTSMAKLRVLFFYDLLSFIFVVGVMLTAIIEFTELEQFVIAKVVAEFLCGSIFFFYIGRFLNEWKRFVLLFGFMLITIILSITAAYFSLRIIPDFESEFVQLILSVIYYFSFLFLILISSYMLGLKKLRHTQHLIFMVKDFIRSLSKSFDG